MDNEQETLYSQLEPAHEQKKEEFLTTPMAIMIASLIIGGAIFFGNKIGKNAPVAAGTPSTTQNQAAQASGAEEGRVPSSSLRPITQADHIFGNKNAPITLLEFSDFQCPFCKRFHPVMQRAVKENKDVRWVYRHFPLTTIHEKAQGAAIASECAALLSGNNAFWQFNDNLFERQSELGDKLYIELARSIGANEAKFSACLKDKKVEKKVNDDLNEAISVGAQGTPFTLVIAGNEMSQLSGAVAYEQVLAKINAMREKIK